MLNLLKSILPSIIKSGEEVLKIYHSDFSVTYKKKEDPLTQADLTVHNILNESIQKIYPGSVLLSEEGSTTNSSMDELWILDPIDGTKDFVKKNNQFAISLAFVRSNGESLGIILNPATGDLFMGVSNRGVSFSKMENPKLPEGFKPLDGNQGSIVSALISNTEYNQNLYWDSYWNNLKIVPMGSIAYKLGLVGVGLHDFTISLKPKNDWDIAAGVCIVQAGGGQSLSLEGNAFNFFTKEKQKKGVIAGRKAFVEEFLKSNYEKLQRDWRMD